MYTAIIFDFFGVIHGDPTLAWLKSIGETRVGKFDEVTSKLDTGDITYQQYLEQLSALSGHTPQEVDAHHTMTAVVDQQLVALIQELTKDFKVALISNADARVLRPNLDRNNLTELFDHIVISSEVQVTKPDPAIFEHTLDLLGTPPEETIFIDDAQKNIDGATSLGITGILYDSAPQLREQLRQLGLAV